MELTYVTIVVLAAMMFVLSGMVGYLYWQQTRMLQHLQSLSMVLSSKMLNQPQPVEEVDSTQTVEPELEVDVPEFVEEEDDRVSVEEKTEVVEGPPDVDDIQTKTASQLRELLTAKGIPYGKRDSKSVLLQHLSANMYTILL